jgi:hypothetical protein
MVMKLLAQILSRTQNPKREADDAVGLLKLALRP